MKKLLTVSLAALSLAFASTASAELKVGTVDMNKVFQGYYKTKDAETKINDARGAAKKELDDRVEGYKKLIDDINKLNDELKKTELSNDTKEQKSKTRDEKINDAKGMEKDINDFRVTREKQLQEQAVRMRNGIVEEINKLIQEKVAAENFDIVFDRSGASLNSVPFMLYARDTFDFSQTIIDTLNKGQTSAPTAAVEKKETPKATPKK